MKLKTYFFMSEIFAYLKLHNLRGTHISEHPKNNGSYKNLIHRLHIVFLVLNLILSVIAFSYIVYAEDTKPTTTPTTPTTSGINPGQSVTVGGTNTVMDLRTGQIYTGGQGPGITPPSTNNIVTGTNTGQTDDDKTTSNTTTTTTSTSIFSSINFASIVMKAGFFGGIGATIGVMAGGDNGQLWGSIAGTVGGAIAGLTEGALGQIGSSLLGVGVAAAIFIFTYKKSSQEIVEFQCLPWQAPIGGGDCEKCNELKECSEYSCKSFGQACDIINPGSKEQKCINKNPDDVNSPLIIMKQITKGYKYSPDNAVRPPATGVKISRDNAECIKAFTPLEFRFETNEPGQCKIDYNLTKGFDEMAFYVGGESLFVYNHTERLSLPTPEINTSTITIYNNRNYILYLRCKDGNGNFNQDPFSVSFCVEEGPDTTPPIIDSVNIPSGNPIQFNKTRLDIEVYVNEPSECKWSKEDKSYSNMENSMACDTEAWEMNNNLVYTCRATLTGIENRKENLYYFRCKDKPFDNENDRNENKQSYLYKVIGTQPLNIISISPVGNETISGSTDTIPVYLEIDTDNGYNNGESICYYSNVKPLHEEDYIQFSDTGGNEHTQRQDLISGNYQYYVKCVDLGGNAAYNISSFRVDVDRREPSVVRIYKEDELTIVTDEKAECGYSTKDCNFEIDTGVKMLTQNNEMHYAEWKINQNYYIRCKDKYENQPNPNVCSIIARPQKIETKSDVIEL